MFETVVLQIHEENLDARSIATLRVDVLNPGQMLVIDLAQVRFVDSSGLGWLVSLRRAYSGQVSLRNVHPLLARFLKRIDPMMLPPQVETRKAVPLISIASEKSMVNLPETASSYLAE